MTLTEKIRNTIELLKDTDINGCITGSSMIPDVDFDEWDSVPDIDLFVYTDMQLLYASCVLMFKHDFEPLNEGEKWKLERIKTKGMQDKAALTTLKLVKDGVVVNITYKKYKNNIMSVLASFDMSCIMIGYDIPFGWGIDMRTRDVKVFEDRKHRWSDDPNVSVPNPMRKQEADRYTTAMWVRQFDRVIKYWNRGVDTRPMARFYIDLINEVIETGSVFQSERDIAGYEEFVEMYAPLRDRMVQWLEDKEDC